MFAWRGTRIISRIGKLHIVQQSDRIESFNPTKVAAFSELLNSSIPSIVAQTLELYMKKKRHVAQLK